MVDMASTGRGCVNRFAGSDVYPYGLLPAARLFLVLSFFRIFRDALSLRPRCFP
jgi:hypothetical protein